MDIQILVNHYKEDEQTVCRFLSSLARQEGVAYEVLLCSDGGNVQITRETLCSFPFSIQYAYAPHSGVCHTRNILLDRSTAKYVMFCDVDDEFTVSDGLCSLLKAAEETGADIVGSVYSVERKNHDGFEYGTLEKDTLRVHGKLFRREYLLENSIRFPDEMETSGDMMFLWLAFALTRKVQWIDKNFYTWKWNSNSVTRQNPFHHVRTYDLMLQCYTILAEDLKKRNRPDMYQALLSTLFAVPYIDVTYPAWMQAPGEYRKIAEKHIRILFRTYIHDYKLIPESIRRSGYNLMKKFTERDGMVGTFENMVPWIENFMVEKEVLIVGHGVVGTNLEQELERLKPAVYDKYKGIDTREAEAQYKVAFICVDTPYSSGHLCDITEVRNAITENDADVYVIKSTVLPGTTDLFCEETGKNIIFSPEYYGGTQHCNNYDFDFTILGGNRESCRKVIQLLQRVYDGRHQFRITDTMTAELVKYMENAYLATKVSFCCQFFDIAEQIGVNYEELRELFVMDPRVEGSHTFVYRDHPFWDSHCLNKDLQAIAEAADADLIKQVIQYNEQCKQKHKE